MTSPDTQHDSDGSDDSDLAELLRPALDADDRTRPARPARLARLTAELAARAEREGLLDVAYRTLDTPVGTLLLAATPVGLVRVAYEGEDLDAVLDRLAGRISPRILLAPARLDDTARQLDEYFTRRRTRFDLPVDLRLAAGFRHEVLAYLPAIRYGETVSYKGVAGAVHHPKAVRAVGSACATNPLPLVIPCHRVVRADGRLGEYVGGPDVKRRLVDFEAHNQDPQP